MRCRALYPALFVLAVLLPRSGSRAVGADPAAPAPPPGRVAIATSAPQPSPAPVPTGAPVVVGTMPPAAPASPAPPPVSPSPRPRLAIASSSAQAAPPSPIVPIPDDGLKLLQPPTAAPAAVPTPSGLQRASYQPPPEAPHRPTPPPPTAPAAPRTACLSLETVGPASASVGQPFAYEIVVRNPGTTAVAGARVRDELPEGARHLQSEPPARVDGRHLEWDLGTVPAGAERRLRVEVQAGREGSFEDQAAATFTLGRPVGTTIQRARLELTVMGPARARVGEPVTFALRVTNNGTGPATHVLVHDHLPAGLKHAQGENVEAEVGTLAPGESRTITLQATAVGGGRWENEAVASADDGLEAPASAAVVVEAPVLAVRKTGPRDAALARELEHRLEVVNTGTTAATGVRLTDSLPDGLDFVAAGDGGTYAAATRTVEWSLGTLAPGQSRAVTVRVLARKPGDWVNQALARADWGLEAKAGAVVHVEGLAALLLQVTDRDDPVEVGAETVYEVRVANQGTGACTGVRLEAVVPDGMTVTATEPAASRREGRRVVFEPVAKLAGKAEAVFRVKVRAKAAGDWRFKAVLACEQLQRPVCREETTRVYDGGDEAGPAAPGPEDIPKR